MPKAQFDIDRTISAKLAYLAELKGYGKLELLKEYVELKITEEFNEAQSVQASPDLVTEENIGTRTSRLGVRVRYKGDDPRLETGKRYLSYAQVLRKARPDLRDKLYDPDSGKGEKAQNLLKRYEPEIHADLERIFVKKKRSSGT